MAQISNCLKLISKIDERDQDALVERIDELQAQGMPAERAQIQAAIDVLAAVQRQAGEAVRSAARVPDVVYHYTSPSNRISIEKNGLIGSDKTSPGGDRVVFVSDTLSPQPGMDVYAINTLGLNLQPDDTTDAPDGERWFSVYGDIDSKKITRSATRLPDGVEIIEVEDGFDAMKDGKRIGRLRDNLPRGAAEQLDENASVDIVKVEPEFKGQGVGAALYDAFNEKHGGRIAPSGKTSPEAWALWKRKFPEKVDAFVEAEAGRIRDGADPFMVMRSITDPEVARRVAEAAPDEVIRSVRRNVEDAFRQVDQLSDAQNIELDALESSLSAAWRRVQSLGGTQQAKAASFTLQEIDADIDDAIDGGTLQEFTGPSGSNAKALRIQVDDVASEAIRSARRQTETPEFKAWSDGLPVHSSFENRSSDRGIYRLFHMTVADFDEFKPGGLNPSDSGPAIWLSTDPSATSAAFRVGNQERGFRAGARTMPVYAKVKNPLVIDDKGMLDYAREAFADGSREFPQLISKVAVDALKSDGYDSIIFDGPGVGWSGAPVEVIVLDGKQIKSAIGNSGAFNPNDADITRSATRPEFFSQLQRSIEQVPDRLATMAAPQWKLWLDANASKLGIKKDEVEFSGVKDYLTLRGKDKVARDELVAYLADSGVRVQEVVLGNQSDRQKLSNEYDRAVAASDAAGGAMNPTYIESLAPGDRKPEEQALLDAWNRVNENPDESWLPEAGNPKYGQYTVPGGENYREVLITLPAVDPDAATELERAKKRLEAMSDLIIEFGNEGNQARAESFQQKASDLQDRIAELEKKVRPKQAENFKSSHFDQPNILAHLRVDDRVDADGNKVLFIGELQSDWGQQAKKDGIRSSYKAEDVKSIQAGDPAAAQPDVFWYFQAPGNVLQIPKSKHATEAAAREYIIREKPVNPSGVPAAPFISDTKSWASLALKRAIMMAVEEGHDKIAIITGEQAAGLYSLDKQVDSITYEPTEKGFYINVLAGGSNIKHGNFTVDELGDIVGKEIVQKMQAREGRQEFDPKVEPDLAETRVLEGDGLKVQATGMRKFYDELIPQVARDVLKKLGGGQLQSVFIPGADAKPAEAFRVGEDGKGGYAVIWRSTGEQVSNHATREEAKEAMRQRRLGEAVEQPGFDITPAMREKVASGVPLFSKGRTASGADWESPSASKFDDLVYKFQDKQIETKRVVEAIKEAAGAISDDLNVYLNEELYHGRAAKRTEDFINMELNPLIADMAKANMKIADLEEFLHARHAKEANAVIAQRNPGEPGLQDGGSGMTNSEADNYMATLPAADRKVLEDAANKVDSIIGGTRKMFVDYELESQATVDGWNGMFKHYVPLQREDKEGSPGLGQGFSIKGKETKGRTGSTRKVVDILANIAMQRERAIVRGEKNRVAQSLVGLVRANENPDFWLVDEVPTERVFNPKTGLVEDRVDPMYKSRENAVVAKIKDPSGAVREHAVLFNEDDPRALRMAQSLKNLDAAKLNGLLGVSAKITRYFAAVNTQYNPVFGVVNLVRDVQGAMLNLSSTPLKDDKAKIAKYTASALAGIYGDMRAARKGKSQTSQWAALWDEFQEVGGQTGYRDLFATSADRAEAIQKALDPNTWMDSKLGKVFTAGGALKVPLAQAQKQAGFLFDWLSDYNNAMENGVRLAAYKAGLERGMTRQQAASAAKNLTTNFNRKGQAAQQAGAMYAFFNAAIQGTARIGQTLFDMEPGKPKTLRLSATGKKIVYGGIVLGSIQALALAAAGFGPEDPPEFARERSLIIPTGGKTYVSIPMPLGMHIIPNIGRVATEFVLSGFKDPIKRSIGLAAMFADAFNPIGNAGMSMQTLAPTALDPLVALTENKDWTGRPIAKTSFNKATPGHALGRDTATALSEVLSEAINTLSGGNKYVAGVFSPTPDQIDYLLGQLTGGVGREYSKTEQTLKSAVRGESLPTYKIPLVGRFVGNAKGQASEGSAFYANVDKLNEIETEVKGLRQDGKDAEARKLLSENPEAYLITQANYAERQAQKLRRQKSELIKAGAPREQVKAVEEQITAVMARLNRAMERLKESAEATAQ